MDKEDVIYTHTHTHIYMHLYTYIHTHTEKYYSAIKNEILLFATTRMDI